MAESSSCTASWRCGAVTPGVAPACPTCGAKTISSNRIRMLGWVLVALGLFLAGFMTYLTLYLTPSFSRPGQDMGELGRWNGTAEQGRAVLNLFWIIIAFGILCVLGGLWQLRTGRRNKAFMVLALLGGAMIAFSAYEANTLLKSEPEEPARIVQPPPMSSFPSPDKPR